MKFAKKIGPLRPGTCLWVIGLFAWPALVESTCAVGVVAVDSDWAVASDETPEAPGAAEGAQSMPEPEPLRSFDEGFVILPR